MAVTLQTSLGDIKLEVFCDLVPRAAKNFLALCASGYYNDTIFHRNIKNFIVQGGDPTGSGKGGESIYGKYFEDEIVDALKFDKRGVVAFASRAPGKNGSQFFITYQKAPHLNSVNTIFAKVIHGFETLDALERVPVDEKDRPKVPVKIERVIIHANPIAQEERKL